MLQLKILARKTLFTRWAAITYLLTTFDYHLLICLSAITRINQNCKLCHFKVKIFGQMTVWNLHLLANNYNFGNFVQPRIHFTHKRFVIIYFSSFIIRDHINTRIQHIYNSILFLRQCYKVTKLQSYKVTKLNLTI